jgi:hypothetical protein
MTANEAQVNRAGVKVDGLVHPVIENTRLEPPAKPELVENNPVILRVLVVES